MDGTRRQYETSFAPSHFARRRAVRAMPGPALAGASVSAQNREDVVAVLALGLRHVHFEPVEEVPQSLGAVAVVDEAVEGREKRDARPDAAVLGLGVRDEASPLEPDAERTEALLVERSPRIRERYRLRLRVPALREVPEPLAGLAAGDGD